MIKSTKPIKMISAAAALAMVLSLLPVSAFAQEAELEVSGTVYEFERSDNYDLSSGEYAYDAGTIGTFTISGDILASSTTGGVPSYCAGDGNLSFYYNYDSSNVPSSVTDDYSKAIDGCELDSSIRSGAIIVQISSDGENWSKVYEATDVFASSAYGSGSIYDFFDDSYDTTMPDYGYEDEDHSFGYGSYGSSSDEHDFSSVSYSESGHNSGDYTAYTSGSSISKALYTTTSVQELNGSYFRAIVVYETAEKTTDRVVFNEYDYTKYAEVYEFYVYNNEKRADVTADATDQYTIGTTYNTDSNFIGNDSIQSGDVHYGWTLGDFFLTGYSDLTSDSDGRPVFLKSSGEEIALWFRLTEDIDSPNGSSGASVYDITSGSDDYFGTGTMDLGRGAVIIRYTDYNGVVHDPVVYTNFLESDASYGSDTKIQMFDEGDYEIALDYEIVNGRFFPSYSNYQIYARFSVRNSDCSVKTVDSVTGADITGMTATSNGFTLDLTGSHYLAVDMKKEVLSSDGNSLTEDTEFSAGTDENEAYTAEGVYTINVSNPYTGEVSSHRLYVGSNKLLKAYMVSGLTLAEIKAKLAEGATISDDGAIIAAVPSTSASGQSGSSSDKTDTSAATASEVVDPTAASSLTPLLVVAIISIILGIVLLVAQRKLD